MAKSNEKRRFFSGAFRLEVVRRMQERRRRVASSLT